MNVQEIDERVIVSERTDTVYYVQIYDPPLVDDGSWAVATYRVTDTEADDVLSWALAESSDGQIYSIAVSTLQDPSDVIWLIGTDPNSQLPDYEDRLKRMISRRRP